MTGWSKSALISSLIILLFLAACGIKGPPVNPSGPWGPMEKAPEDQGQSD